MAITFSKDRYTLWYNTSLYHNLPFINGVQQEATAASHATNVRFKEENGLVHFSMDLEKAYDTKAGLKNWNRDILVDQNRNNITIRDSYRFLQPHPQLTQSFMTVCNTDISQPGKILFTTEKNGKVVMTYNATDWKISKEKMPLAEPHEQGLKANWNNKTIWRILLTNISQQQEGGFVYGISMQ